MRAYPDGARVNSSNPDPSPFWRQGVQMVAMNWQSLDEGMMLNEGMFADEQGWVLKPEGYRSLDKHTETHLDVPSKSLDLKISVLAGQHVFVLDPGEGSETKARLKSLRPAVKCELHCEKAKEKENGAVRECKQRTKNGETDHPNFGEGGCTLLFEGLRDILEELTFVRYASALLSFLFCFSSSCPWARFPPTGNMSTKFGVALGQFHLPKTRPRKALPTYDTFNHNKERRTSVPVNDAMAMTGRLAGLGSAETSVQSATHLSLCSCQSEPLLYIRPCLVALSSSGHCRASTCGCIAAWGTALGALV